jgi:hypothetical protein
VLVAFAYLEEDSILLAISLLISLALFAVAAVTLHSAIAEIIWLTR